MKPEDKKTFGFNFMKGKQMTDILPVGGLGDGAGVGSAALGAFGGALIGSWFGDAWGGYGWGNRGGGGDCSCAAAAGFGTSILNDGINAIQNSVNGMNMNLSSGLCNIGYQTLDQSSRTNLAMMQGFSTIGHDNCQNTNNIVSAINNVGFQNQNCCCQTQKLIAEEGCATRQLIQNNLINDLQTKLCDAKADNAALKSQLYTTNVVNGQTAVLLAAINARPTTTASAAA